MVEDGTYWHRKWSGEGPNNQTIAARRTVDWQLAGRSTRQRINTECTVGDGGGRVGIRALVLQPHAAVPLPLLAPEVRQVRRAPLRRTDFEQLGHTDNCLVDAPTQELVVNKRWIIQNNAVPA